MTLIGRFPFVLTALMVAGVGLLVPAGRLVAETRTVEMTDVWNGDEIEWREIRDGIRESDRTGRRAIMVFHAPWCTACQKYREVFRDPGVVAASKKFVMILVNVDSDEKANEAFSPDGTYVPRTIFFSSTGDVLDDYVGQDAEFPHAVNINAPDELRTLMQNASRDAEQSDDPPPAATAGKPKPQAPTTRIEQFGT